MQRRNIYIFLGLAVLLVVSGVGFLTQNPRESSIDDVTVEFEKKGESKEMKEEEKDEELEVEVVPTRPVARGVVRKWNKYADTYDDYLKEWSGLEIEGTSRNKHNYGYKITRNKIRKAPKDWISCNIEPYGIKIFVPPTSDCIVYNEEEFKGYNSDVTTGPEVWGGVDIDSKRLLDESRINYLSFEIMHTAEVRDRQSIIPNIDVSDLDILPGKRHIFQYIYFAGSFSREIEILLDGNTTLILSFLFDEEEGDATYTFPDDFQEILETIVESITYEG